MDCSENFVAESLPLLRPYLAPSRIPHPPFQLGAVTFLALLLSLLGYLSGNIPQTLAYSGRKRTPPRCRALKGVFQADRGYPLQWLERKS